MGFASNLEILKYQKITLSSLKSLYKDCECKDMYKRKSWANAEYSPIMILGQNPTYYVNDKNEKSFSVRYFDTCKSGNFLRESFKKINIDFDKCYITNLVKCASFENAKLDRKIIIKCFKKFVLNELKFINPEIIFCLGKDTYENFKYIIDNSKLKDNFKNKFIVYLPHPSAALRNKNITQKVSETLSEYKELIQKIMRDSQFNHLHFHNHFSLHDSLTLIPQQVNKLLKTHKKQIVSTNHGSLCDSYQILKKAKENNLKAVLGCEIYCMENIKEFKEIENAKERKKYAKENRRHLVLIAKNKKGFENLIKIHNWGWMNGFYYRPTVDLNYVLEHSEGLIATTACVFGLISAQLLKKNYINALRVAKKLKEVFKDDLYIELILINFVDQIKITNDLIKIAQKLKIKTIITNDVHYIDKSKAKYRDFIFKLFNRVTLKTDVKKDKKCVDLYFKTLDEMKTDWMNQYKSEIFTEKIFEDSVDNVIDILDSIENYDIEGSAPSFYKDSFKIFIDRLKKAFKKRLSNLNKEDQRIYLKRLKMEIEIIKDKNLIDYFLIVSDIVNFVRQKFGRYYVGVGRGSAAGSLVNYLLDVTLLDPIKFELLFERFLSKEREDVADIDVDFVPSIKSDVLSFIKETWGNDKIIQIGTQSYIKTRNAIQDVSRYFEIPSREVYDLTTQLFDIEEHKSLEELELENEELRKFLKKYSFIREYVRNIRNVIRQYSSHAAGVVISDKKISDNMPVVRTSSTIVSGWQDGADYRELTGMGYYKYDLLSLNNLAIINDTLKLISERHEKNIDLENIDLFDKRIFEYMRLDDYMGIFQFESVLARRAIRLIKPDSFEDYVATNSLLRPGPLRAGMVGEYAKRKQGLKTYVIHDELKDILQRTYGIITEQEQIMRICNEIGGLDLNKANKFRKVLVKYSRSLENEIERLTKVMSYKDQFLKNASKKLGKEKAKEIFDLILSWANYGFNRCISGDSYVYVPSKRNVLNDRFMKKIKISQLYKSNYTDIYIYDIKNKRYKRSKIKKIYKTGRKETYWTIVRDRKRSHERRIRTTLEHRFLTKDGWKRLKELKIGDEVLVKQGYCPEHMKGTNNPGSKKKMGFARNPLQKGDEFVEPEIREYTSYRMSQAAQRRKIQGMKGKHHTKETIEKIRRRTLLQYKNNEMPQTDTAIHRKVYHFVAGLNIGNFVKEYSLQNKYSIDIADSDLKIAIETHGDFWHANPKYYKNKILTKIQKRNLIRDVQKRAYLKRKDWTLIELFEDDINNRFDECKDKILRVLSDYKKNPWSFQRIEWIGKYGFEDTYDLEIEDSNHNYVSNMFVVHNSHSLSYAMTAYWEMFLKTYYSLEFYVALLNNTSNSVKDKQLDFKVKRYIISIVNHGFEILPADINKSKAKFNIEDEKIRYGLSYIKNVTEKDYDEIKIKAPFKDFDDFYNRITKKVLNKRKVESLIFAGAFDSFGSRKDMFRRFHELRKEKNIQLDDINFGEKNIEALYWDLEEMRAFFKRYDEINRTYNITLRNDYMKVNFVMKKSRYYFVSLYSERQFVDRCFVSSKINGIRDLKRNDEIFALIKRDDKGTSLLKMRKITKRETDVS